MKTDRQKDAVLPNPKGAKELKEAHKALRMVPINKELVDFLKALKADKDTPSGSPSGGESYGVPLAAKDSKE